MRFRFYSIIGAALLLFMLLIGNLYDVQVRKGKFYAARAESQFRLAGLLEPRRGVIFFTDRNSNHIPAALNREYRVVYAVPKQVENTERTAEILGEILGVRQDTLRQKFMKSNDPYEPIAEKLTDEQVDAIREADLGGVYLDTREFRFYPFGSLAAHLLGFVGPSGRDDGIRGRYGVEAYYEDSLRGAYGSMNGVKVREPKDGKDLYLTIDRNIQSQAEEVLKKTIKRNRAVGGTVIVMEPETGKVLALASSPTFDPNDYAKSKIGTFLDPAVQGIYEPGSVLKVVTMSAAIDTGAVTPETTFVDTGSFLIDGKRITNYSQKAYGTVSMAEVIEHSINTGAVFAMRQTGREIFHKYLERFGLNKRSDIELPGEVNPNLRTLTEDAPEINFATAAFGQGIAVTPISLLTAVSAIANNGVLMRPYLRIGDGPVVRGRAVSSATAESVTKMMTAAVKEGKIAVISGYGVAGKTGTAQVPDFSRGGYTDEFIHTFVGFAPSSNPMFSILVKIDKPQVGVLAGLTVVPAFREIAEFTLNYYGIPPDKLESQRQ